MSWTDCLNTLMKYDKINAACIAGPDGAVWASSPNFQPEATEIKTIVSSLQSKTILPSFLLAGQKFLLLRGDVDTLDGKLKNNAISVAFTGKCVVIGGHLGSTETVDPGVNQVVNMGVSRMRDYLISVGY